MQNLIDYLKNEAEIFEAVQQRNGRSFYMFIAGCVMPTLFMLFVSHLISSIPHPAMARAFWPATLIIGLLLMVKMLALSVRMYMKDRAALLRF